MELLTTNALSLFETTKEARAEFVDQIIEQVQDGKLDPIKVHLQLKCAEDIIKQITGNDCFKKNLMDDCDKQGGKSFMYQNAKFERKEVGVKYDYSQCNDAKLAELEAELAQITESVKARQALLKNAPQSGLIVTDPESGETYTVYPPSKSSTTSIAVTLK
jgi:hypothetical protein